MRLDRVGYGASMPHFLNTASAADAPRLGDDALKRIDEEASAAGRAHEGVLGTAVDGDDTSDEVRASAPTARLEVRAVHDGGSSYDSSLAAHACCPHPSLPLRDALPCTTLHDATCVALKGASSVRTQQVSAIGCVDENESMFPGACGEVLEAVHMTQGASDGGSASLEDLLDALEAT